MTENKGHVHAASMLAYAQDAAETDKPWERWQRKYSSGEMHKDWETCDDHPSWLKSVQYRRKPQTKKYILELPEPIRERPKIGDMYWLPVSGSIGATQEEWKAYPHHQYQFSMGILFKTKEDAIAFSDALKNRQ